MKRSTDTYLSIVMLGAVAVAVLSACGSAPGGQVLTASPSQSSSEASPTRTASPSSGPPTPAGALCELPVYGAAFVLQGNQAAGKSGGFVTIPGGSFTLAPETVSDRPPEQVSGWTYSTKVSSWLPVRPEAVSPDGSRYAWIEYLSNRDQRVHVVDAATNKDSVLVATGDLDFPQWQPDGIYLDHHLIGTDYGRGLVRLDPVTGESTEVSVPDVGKSGGWVVHAGGAWLADWHPGPMISLDRGADRLRRYDLATGRVDTWFYDSSRGVELQGFDSADHPVVGLEDWGSGQPRNPRLLTLTQPNVGTTLWAADGVFDMSVRPDAHGLWFLSITQGIWLLRAGANQPEKISAVKAYGISGPCI